MNVKMMWFTGEEDAQTCFISQNIFDALKLSVDVAFNLHVGQWCCCNVHLQPIAGSEDCLYLSPAMVTPFLFAKQLHVSIFENVHVNIWITGSDIHLGPVLGIFVSPGRLTVPKNRSSIHRHMQAGLAQHFLTFFFSLLASFFQICTRARAFLNLIPA